MTHNDHFSILGRKKFSDRLKKMITYMLNISKAERIRYTFTGIDIENRDGKIRISMEDYADRIKVIS